MLRLLIVTLTSSLVILGAVLAVRKANCSVTERYRQLLLPVVSVIYGIALVVFFNQLSTLLHRVLLRVEEYVPLLGTFNPAVIEAMAFNVAILLGFVVIKGIYFLLARMLRGPLDRLFRGVRGWFYAYDERNERWNLRDDRKGVRRLFRNLYWTIVVLTLLLFVFANLYPEAAVFRNVFYPALPILLLGEVYFFLDGLTEEEYRSRISVEDDLSRRTSQYAKAQKALEHYFSDRLLYAFAQGTWLRPQSSHRDFCEELARSTVHSERLAGTYFKSLVDKGLVGVGSVGEYGELNHDIVLNMVRLMEGQSVMFASPFYRDYLPYVFLPVSTTLLRGGKVLVLCADGSTQMDAASADSDSMRDYLSEGLAFVSNVEGMWRIGNVAIDDCRSLDVAIMPFSSLGDTALILAMDEFLGDVAFVLVVDPSSMLATYQVGLSLLSDRLSHGRSSVYCIFDRNEDGLVDSLSHALRTSLLNVAATDYCKSSNVGMMWDVDGEFLQHRLFPGVAHYLGVGAELGLVALRSQIPRVTWAANSSVPLHDLRWIMGQYYGEFFGFAGLPQEQNQIDKRFAFHSELWSTPKSQRCFVMVDDEYFNLFEMYRQFATRGEEQAFVNILSSNYLLRDYMVANHDMLLKDPKAIPSLAADFAKSRRNVVFSIVMMMVQGARSVPESEIASRLRYIGVLDGRRSVIEALQGMLVENFDVYGSSDCPEDHIVLEERTEYVPATRSLVTNRYLSFDGDAPDLRVFAELRNVPLITEAPDGTCLYLGSRLFCHVYQQYLPSQFVVVGGKYYEVMAVGSDTGIVLRRAADHFSRRRYYRQLRRYMVQDWSEEGRPGASQTLGGIRVVRGRASVSVETMGYLDLADYGDVSQGRRVELSGIPERRYSNKEVMRIDLGDASPHVCATLAVLMSEMLKTLYPKDYAYLAILAPSAELAEAGILYDCELPVSEGSIYVVEDSLIDIGLISSFDRNLTRILELCWDWLDWHESQMGGQAGEVQPYEIRDLSDEELMPKRRKGLFGRILDKVRGLFKKSESAQREASDSETPSSGDEVSDEVAEGTAVEASDGLLDDVAEDEPVEQNPAAEAPAASEGDSEPTEGDSHGE